jgi:hypothetical protein
MCQKHQPFLVQETPMTTMTHYSRHAQVRQQQRGIPSFVVESLIRFGKPNYDHRGAEVITFPKPVRNRLKAVLPKQEYVQLESQFDCYAVMKDGYLITVGHRTIRIKD